MHQLIKDKSDGAQANRIQLEAFTHEAPNNTKRDKDLNEFNCILKKITAEVALNTILNEHANYDGD